MVTRKQLLKELLEKQKDIKYNKETETLSYAGVEIPFERYYQTYLSENGMSFKCICDIHWECTSIIECTKCGTVVKEHYDEDYEPNFRCPTCTGYKTGYEYYTKEEIENNKDLQSIIEMYRELNEILEEQEKRREQRGLEDNQLFRPMNIKIGNTTYRINLLINSILNKNKLRGLRLQVEKYEKEDVCLTRKWFKTIPLSKEALDYKRHEQEYKEAFEREFQGKPLSQTLEEHAVQKIKKQ